VEQGVRVDAHLLTRQPNKNKRIVALHSCFCCHFQPPRDLLERRFRTKGTAFKQNDSGASILASRDSTMVKFHHHHCHYFVPDGQPTTAVIVCSLSIDAQKAVTAESSSRRAATATNQRDRDTMFASVSCRVSIIVLLLLVPH
jgi:hypothetical protein